MGTVFLDLVPALQDYLISFPPAGAFVYRSEQNTRHGPAPRWSSCSAGGLVTASVHVPDTSFPLRSLSFSSCFFYVFTPCIINVAILLRTSPVSSDTGRLKGLASCWQRLEVSRHPGNSERCERRTPQCVPSLLRIPDQFSSCRSHAQTSLYPWPPTLHIVFAISEFTFDKQCFNYYRTTVSRKSQCSCWPDCFYVAAFCRHISLYRPRGVLPYIWSCRAENGIRQRESMS